MDQVQPSFQLLVKKLRGNAPNPTFPSDWDEGLSRWGRGLTILRTDQCPYLDDAVKMVQKVADDKGIEGRVVELENTRMVQERSPAPYGVFHLILDGKLLSHHYLLEKELRPILAD